MVRGLPVFPPYKAPFSKRNFNNGGLGLERVETQRAGD
jgi:hypothetical protein